jgi:cell division protein ZapA
MAQVTVTINGRQYRMACEDGEEERLLALGRGLDQRIGELREKFGEIGDARLTVMAALLVADELAEAENRIAALEQERGRLQEELRTAWERLREVEAAAAHPGAVPMG